jgi:hypothetical protein
MTIKTRYLLLVLIGDKVKVNSQEFASFGEQTMGQT